MLSLYERLRIQVQNDFDFIDLIERLPKNKLDAVYASYRKDINKLESTYLNYEDRKDFCRMLRFFERAYAKFQK